MPDHSTARSEPLWRHSAFSSSGGLRVTRPLRGFGPLSFSFPLRKNTRRQKLTGPSPGDSTFGSRDRAPNWLSSSHGVRCLRAFPVAVPRLCSPSLSAWNWYPGRPPLSPQGRPDFSPLREEATQAGRSPARVRLQPRREEPQMLGSRAHNLARGIGFPRQGGPLALL
jgi:hypothetical protein